MATLNIGADFSNVPLGRFYSDDVKSSGEGFREDFLLPMLKNLQENEKLTIILDDNVEGYGSSFLTEGFAGVVKYGYMPAEELLKKIEIKYTDPDYEFYSDKLITYIKEAKFNSEIYIPTEKLES